MSLTKRVDSTHWVEFLSMLSNGNKGRMIGVETKTAASGVEEFIAESPLFAIDYDPLNKGNDLVISVGRDSVTYEHTIAAPVEIWQSQDDAGRVSAIEVVDQNGDRTLISFSV